MMQGSQPEFIPGLPLSEAYYREAVRPILDAHFPDLPHSAALLGFGSDVMGFDTPVSADHLWGPRVYLFLRPEDLQTKQAAIYEALRNNLPVRFRGYSTHFSKPDPRDGGVRVREDIEQGPIEPLIFFETIEGFWKNTLGVAPDTAPSPADWLTFQEQRLIEVTAGKVFHDDLRLEEARRRFAYYPEQVWLYLLASQWELIAQEEAFVGRTHQTGDELGSGLIAARQVEKLMRLCFLMEKRYAPYSKWFGTAFQRLNCAPRMAPLLAQALNAADYSGREKWLAAAYLEAIEMHNRLGITAPVEARTRTYAGWHALRGGVEELALDDPRNTRPHLCIFAGQRLAEPIYAAITDPEVLALRPRLGSVNQFLVESSPAVESTAFCHSLKDNLKGTL